MSRCRIASRVASSRVAGFACIQPELRSFLATKVSPFQLLSSHPSRPSQPGRPGHPRLPSADIGAGGGGVAAAWLAARRCVGGNGRRVALSLASPQTPLIITILVTNGDFSGDAL
jgi:hypothetical protein